MNRTEGTSRPRIVAAPADVDAAWLTQVLAQAGHDGVVEAFEAAGVGTGQVGQNVRFRLRYASGSGPASIVGKFASDDPESRQTGISLLNYFREVRFYQELRPTLDVQTPKVLFTDIDPETHAFSLMMEDLAPAQQGDQLAGCGADEAALAIAELSRLHGPRWNDPTLADIAWLGGTEEQEGPNMVQQLWSGFFEGFLARYASRLTAAEIDCARTLGDRLDAYTARRPGPRTVTHGDYRLDNMMFGGPYPLAVVDWQSPALGLGTADAAYFMGTALEGPERRACEREIIGDYHRRLQEYGAHDYDFATCWTDYRRAAYAGLVMAVIASMIVGQTERGDEMFMKMARRSVAMAIDLDAAATL
ncbi:MAG TPA: phosphotransferase [Pseudomonadales bacterium]|nr:phosphotransferase [Pseudomonadales bacterium]